MKIAKQGRRSNVIRYLLGGFFNTVFSYIVYYALHCFLPFQAAYFVAYAVGTVSSFFINSLFVFRVQPTWRKFFSFPIVYVVQYAVSAGFLEILVKFWGVDVSFAPLVVTVAVLPLTYLLTRFFIGSKSRVGARGDIGTSREER